MTLPSDFAPGPGDVLPPLPALDVVDGGLMDAILFRQRTLRASFTVDCANLRLGQLGKTVSLTARLSTLAYPIGGVICGSAQKQVIYIDASRCVAPMEDVLPSGDWAVADRPLQATRAPSDPINPERRIAEGMRMAPVQVTACQGFRDREVVQSFRQRSSSVTRRVMAFAGAFGHRLFWPAILGLSIAACAPTGRTNGCAWTKEIVLDDDAFIVFVANAHPLRGLTDAINSHNDARAHNCGAKTWP